MMTFKILIAASLLATGPAAFAQSLHETHAEVRMPVGKTVRLYRPLNRADCAAAQRYHQAGKGQMPAAASNEALRCDSRLLASRAAATSAN